MGERLLLALGNLECIALLETLKLSDGDPDALVLVRELAQSTGIPEALMARVVRVLEKHELVEFTPAAGGGVFVTPSAQWWAEALRQAIEQPTELRA